MAIIYNAEDFIGGGDALDGYDGADLLDGMKAAVFSPDSFAPYILDDDSAAGENSPQIISPDANPGDKRWILQKGIFAELISYGVVSIGAASGNGKLSVTGIGADHKVAAFLGDDASYNRIGIDGPIDADSQLSFCHGSSTCWSIGNNADDDAFMIRTGAGAFGTNDKFTIAQNGDVTFTGSLAIGNGKTIGQGGGPQLTFDDTNNYLEITGCDVAVGGAIARTKFHVITTNDSAIDWSAMIQNLHAASGMGGTGVGLKLKTYSDSQTQQNIDKWVGIAAESHATPTYGKRVDMVFYTVADASAAAPTEKMRILGPGNVGIGTPTPICTQGGLDISSGGLSLIIGANAGASARSNELAKDGRFGCIHYTTAEEPLGIVLASSTVADSILHIGGGSSFFNAATELRFYTAANNVTQTGSVRMKIKTGGNVNLTGALEVDDVQVVSNRVIDARCDDAINTGDATSDGVIDSLRDAMITHGLIAAA